MTRAGLILISLFALAMPIGTAIAAPGAGGHSHDQEEYSAGAPGDPKKPARIVNVVMDEKDGKMVFIPESLQVRAGEQVRFKLRNNGELEHEFVLATTAENLKHAEAMAKHPDMEHDDPNALRLKPKAIGELLWRFTNSGTFEFACLIPGHREAGMLGSVKVK